MTPSIVLCGTTISNYYSKVKLALLEKGLPFEERLVMTGRGDDPEVTAASPLAKVPYVLVDGRPLCESQVIVDWLEAAFPHPPLVPADPFAAAKVREIATFVDLHVELVARELYREAFFGGSTSDSAKARVKTLLVRHLAALRRLAPFAPYAAGEAFTLADCSAWASLGLVAMATRAIYGEDFVTACGIELKAYNRLIGERPTAQRIVADRKAEQAARNPASS
jgi:glutathione S-transferase